MARADDDMSGTGNGEREIIPRARHDAGPEPVDWGRVVLLAGLVVVAVTAGLAGAGALRRGPLDDLGWTERRVPAEELLPVEGEAGADATELLVAVTLPGPCPQEVTVAVRETRRTVELGTVRVRRPRFGPACPRERHYVRVELREPVGERRVVRRADGSRLRVVAPATTGV